MNAATLEAEQLSFEVSTAHLNNFEVTRFVIFVGSAAVINRLAETQSHSANGVLRLFVSNLFFSHKRKLHPYISFKHQGNELAQ